MSKRNPLASRPPRNASVERWLRHGQAHPDAPQPHEPRQLARLTVDIAPALRGRIKVAAYRQGITVATLLRRLLDMHFPAEPTEP